MAAPVGREILADGTVRLSVAGCSFVYESLRPGLLRIAVRGFDAGQLGTAPLDEIATVLNRERPLELFIDARAGEGATTEVSDAWIRFLAANRSQLTKVHVLVESKALYLTIAVAQHLAHHGELMCIYSDREIFEARLARACAARPQ